MEEWEKHVIEKTKLRTYMLVKPEMGTEEYMLERQSGESEDLRLQD